MTEFFQNTTMTTIFCFTHSLSVVTTCKIRFTGKTTGKTR